MKTKIELLKECLTKRQFEYICNDIFFQDTGLEYIQKAMDKWAYQLLIDFSFKFKVEFLGTKRKPMPEDVKKYIENHTSGIICIKNKICSDPSYFPNCGDCQNLIISKQV